MLPIHRLHRAKSLIVLLVGLVVATACDPCFGTTACQSGRAQLVMEGQIVRAEDGRGVDGIRIDVIRVGGTSLESDSVSVVTSGGGFWRVTDDATNSGAVAIVDVHVATPLMPHGYMVHALQVPLSNFGNPYLADRWVSELYYPYYLQFFRRGQPGRLFTSTPVTFHQTGGPLLRGASADSTVATATDIYGNAQGFFYNAFASDTGIVFGDVTLQPPLAGASVVRGLTLSPTYRYRSVVVRDIGVGPGPSLAYSEPVFNRATGGPFADIGVTIRRVGGVRTDIDSIATATDLSGNLYFPMLPLDSGSLIADVTIYPPVGVPETVRDTLSTFDADGTRLLARWNVGAALPYYGTVLASGAGLGGVPVRIHRTGGIPITPADTTVMTLPNGQFPISGQPLDTGSVTVELTFTPPAPYPHFTVSNVVISTIQRDTLPLNVWTWQLDQAITGPPGSKVTPLP